MTETRLTELFVRWTEHKNSPEEEAELFSGLNDQALEKTWQSLFESAYDRLPDIYMMSTTQSDSVFNQIIQSKAAIRNVFTLRRIAVAASILLILGFGSYFFLKNRQTAENTIAKRILNIPAPSTTHAMITLSNGTNLLLDSASGMLASQGTIQISKLGNGEIEYTGNASGEITYNTLTNPRGSRVVTITLNDGTRVWLNTESSLRYPTAFSGKERKVEITGEAYFEVTHNANMPFIVTKGDTKLQVLGTHFNVNAYSDEPEIKVTLLEGAVMVTTPENSRRLSPNEQAIIQKDQIALNRNANIKNVMAWKNGIFDFGSRADLKQIMRQIARWYDVDVVYQGNIPIQQFGGEMSRNSDLNQVLEILKTSGVHFSIENKKIIVMP